MKRILIFSDTHGDINLCVNAINTVPADMILHAGDYVRDAEDLVSIYPDKDIRYIKGNNDLWSKAPRYIIVEVDGIKILVVHGHEQHVKYEINYSTLAEFAKNKDCNIAVFGHTHIPFEGETDNIKLINPGSVRFGGTYAILEIENGKCSSCIMK